MKRYIFLCITSVFLVSCEKEPGLEEVRKELVTYTQYDLTEDFGKSLTFFVADKVLVVNNNIKGEPEYLTESATRVLIKRVVTEMISRGYKRVKDKGGAHLGIQISYIENTGYFIDYNNQYWWNDYPWYWEPCYWGDCGAWFYPYPNAFYYADGSLLIDMIRLYHDGRSVDGQLPVIWQAYTLGIMQGNAHQQLINARNAIKQSFEQSPYILCKDR